MTKNTITTVEGLAEMIQRTRASKEDIQEVTEDMKAIEGRLATQLDRIERVLREEQQRNIEHLDARTKTLEDALAVSPSRDPRPHHTGGHWRAGQDLETARDIPLAHAAAHLLWCRSCISVANSARVSRDLKGPPR